MKDLDFIAGIDYSLCGPAICINNLMEKFSFHSCQFFFLTSVKKHARRVKSNIQGENFAKYNEEVERYETIADWALDKVMGCQSVGLEGYAYNATGKVFHIAENTGVLKYKLFQNSKPVDIFPPSEVKKYSCGKGNGSKNDMYDAFFEETNVPLKSFFGLDGNDVKSPISDIVDSYFVCKYLRHKVYESSS